MKIFLHIKGKQLWRVIALVMLGVVLACCGELITSVDQPATATVGSTINIAVHVDIPTASSGGPDYLIFGFLVPKGWNTAQNTSIKYTSPTLGDGVMNLVPAGTIAVNSNGLTWPDYMRKTFGIGGNLIDDMEWVAYQTDKAFTHNGSEITGTLNITTKVGADGNNTLVKLGYVITDTGNGFTSNQFGTYYSEKVTDCFTLTGGPGDIVDFCHPQLTVMNPPKSLDNDFITLTFDGTVVDTDLKGADAVYLCATAYTDDGKTLSVCEQTDKTKMAQTTSNRYQITLWPRSFFGVADGHTITKMEYFIKDKTGTKLVGYGNDKTVPFVFTFKCN